jgi:D-glycero-alpha-D-manno-heptose-7-phosphate kinase
MIRVTSPTRVDLAGGTLDLWPLHAFLGSCYTINVAINIDTEVILEPLEGTRISLKSLDFQESREFSHLQELLEDQDPRWALLKNVISFFKPSQGFILTTKSGSPVGGGLGGSSSLVISLIKAFKQWTEQYCDYTPYQWVEIAHNIEARVLRTPTGTQDYYPALVGGLNCLGYSDRGVSLTQYDLESFRLPAQYQYFLVDTGRSHHSGLNNFDVLSRFVRGEESVIQALRGLQLLSYRLKEEIKKSPSTVSWFSFFQQEYDLRVQLSPSFSSPEIESLFGLVKTYREGEKPSVTIKILGAGGGGCVLVWSLQNNPHLHSLKKEIEYRGFKIIPIDFVSSF